MEWLRAMDGEVAFGIPAAWLSVLALWLFLFALIAAEQIRPLHDRRGGSSERIVTNFALGLTNAAILTVLPLSAVAAAQWAQVRAIGALNLLPVPPAGRFVATLMIWSLAIYLLHVISHKVPLLWRLHQVHHCDTALDLSTGVRHHPLDLLFNSAGLGAAAVLLGLDSGAILAYAIVAAIFALWTHANVRLPARADRVLRLGLVTAAAHHIHHSAARAQTDSNYGDVMILWDRLFGTYCDFPQAELPAMRVGLGEAHDGPAPRLLGQLLLPFPGSKSERRG